MQPTRNNRGTNRRSNALKSLNGGFNGPTKVTVYQYFPVILLVRVLWVGTTRSQTILFLQKRGKSRHYRCDSGSLPRPNHPLPRIGLSLTGVTSSPRASKYHWHHGEPCKRIVARFIRRIPTAHHAPEARRSGSPIGAGAGRASTKCIASSAPTFIQSSAKAHAEMRPPNRPTRSKAKVNGDKFDMGEGMQKRDAVSPRSRPCVRLGIRPGAKSCGCTLDVQGASGICTSKHMRQAAPSANLTRRLPVPPSPWHAGRRGQDGLRQAWPRVLGGATSAFTQAPLLPPSTSAA